MRIQYIDDVNGNFQEAHGSDGRLNVSSRADDRAYYNSRDEEQCYTMVYTHPSAANSQYSFFLQNTSATRDLVVSSVGVNSDDILIAALFFASGTATNGVTVTPTNLNAHSSKAATATALGDEAGTAIAGFTEGSLIDRLSMPKDGHEEFRLGDRVRLGQNDAICLKSIAGTSTPDISGVVFFYFE